MALRFQPPNLPQVKSKTAAFTEAVQPGLQALSNLPSTIAYFKAHKAEMDQKNQALALQKRQTNSQFGSGAAAPAPLLPGSSGPEFQESQDQLLARVGTSGIDAKVKQEELKQKNQPTWIIDNDGNKVTEIPAGIHVEKLAAPYQAVIPTYDSDGNVTGFTKAAPGSHVSGGGKPQKSSGDKPKTIGGIKDTLREYDNMIKEAQSIKDDPSLPYATGIAKIGGSIPGTGAKRVSSRLETLKAKTLLNVLTSLKTLSKNGGSGFGALSDTEGESIKSSISSLDRGQNTKDFQDSLDRFVTEMEARKETLKNTFKDSFGEDFPDGSSPGLPSMGDLFQGHKVLSVKKVE